MDSIPIRCYACFSEVQKFTASLPVSRPMGIQHVQVVNKRWQNADSKGTLPILFDISLCTYPVLDCQPIRIHRIYKIIPIIAYHPRPQRLPHEIFQDWIVDKMVERNASRTKTRSWNWRVYCQRSAWVQRKSGSGSFCVIDKNQRYQKTTGKFFVKMKRYEIRDLTIFFQGEIPSGPSDQTQKIRIQRCDCRLGRNHPSSRLLDQADARSGSSGMAKPAQLFSFSGHTG